MNFSFVIFLTVLRISFIMIRVMSAQHFYLTLKQERPIWVPSLAVSGQEDLNRRFAFASGGVVG